MSDKDDPIIETYVLKKPYVFAEEKVYQLEFREIKTKHNVAVEKIRSKGAGHMEQIALYIHLLCRIVPESVNEMSHVDFMAAGEIVSRFLDQGLPTTETT